MKTTLRINNWQEQGWFAEIFNADGSVSTLPHPNMDCPRELYKTESEAINAVVDWLLTQAAPLVRAVNYVTNADHNRAATAWCNLHGFQD